MWRLSILLTLAALGATSLAACGDDEAKTPSDAPTAGALDGRSFVSTRVEGHALVPGTAITLAFDGGNLGVAAGCNQQSAAYVVAAGTLRWNAPPAGTLIGCEPALQQQDEWLAGLFTAGMEATLTGKELRLAGEGVVVELVEGPAAGAPRSLAGTAWTLRRAVDRDGKVSLKAPAGADAPTLKFGGDGDAVTVFTGCNRGGGKADVREDGLIVFGPLALTRMACAGAAARLEALVTRVLDGKTAYSFDGNTDLVIAKNGDHLTYAPH